MRVTKFMRKNIVLVSIGLIFVILFHASGLVEKGLGMKKKSKDEALESKAKEKFILSITENGYGKRSSLEDYRITNRGGKGVKTISITEKTGSLVSIKNVSDGDDLMIINKSGIAIRMEVNDLRVMGRATQGVKLINIKENDSIAAVAKVVLDDEDVQDVEDIEVVDDNQIN